VAEPVDIGDCVKVEVVWTNAVGQVADPTVCEASLRKPDGSVTQIAGGSISHDGTGRYSTDILPDQSGEWWVRFVATGTVIAAEEYSFIVKAKRV
jgi:hypothetical protein